MIGLGQGFQPGCWLQGFSLIKREAAILVVGAVCNRDGLDLSQAANRGYNPLPHTINQSLNLY